MDEKRKSSAEAAAARWMILRDRGFTPTQQDEYLQWLSEDPAHGAEVARLARAWSRLDALRLWNPSHSVLPNAELLRPPPRRRWFGPTLMLAAAAVAAMLIALVWLRAPAVGAAASNVIVHPGPQRMTLADGSMVELNVGAKVDVQFTPEQRDVHLLQGEAHFIVAKNPARPFIVTAGNYTVRAVGTAFDVSLAEHAVSVLVTEGHVQLGAPAVAPEAASLPHLIAGQQAIVSGGAEPGVQVRELTPAQIEAALEWQSLRLEFKALPLREVVAEFNRYNSRKLIIDDAATGDLIVGGTFRADNVEAFVRLLNVGFGTQVENRGDNLVLSLRSD